MNYANAFADMMKNPSELLKNNFDYNQVLNTGRRNMEAASEASQVIVESAQTISRRQAEIAREGVESALKASKDIFTSGTPETNIAKQTEFAKAAFESSLSNLREISEMFVKSAFEAFDVFSSRASESIDEISKATKTAAPAAKKKSA
jgi:phasin family protein